MLELSPHNKRVDKAAMCAPKQTGKAAMCILQGQGSPLQQAYAFR